MGTDGSNRTTMPISFLDWMNHDTGKSCKLNDNDMMEIQTSASEILEMEREQSKAETGKEHLERNDFILGKTEIRTP